MLSAGNLAPYVGFTEEEVQKLAEEYHQDFNGKYVIICTLPF